MLRNIVLAICGVAYVVGAHAADDENKPNEVVIYKWKTGGLTHYAKQPPRFAGSIVKLDEDGQVIHDDDSDMATYESVRPVRPGQSGDEAKSAADSTKSASDAEGNGEGELPEGAITKEQRCANARQDIKTIQSAPADKPVTVEDENGNLIPMSDAQRMDRLQKAQQLVQRLCN